MFNWLKCDGYNFSAIIVGDGIERDRLMLSSEKYQLTDIVSFVGFKEDVANYFNK